MVNTTSYDNFEDAAMAAVEAAVGERRGFLDVAVTARAGAKWWAGLDGVKWWNRRVGNVDSTVAAWVIATFKVEKVKVD